MSSYQFTADNADIVLRASRCDVPREFRVHKTILSIASPVFKDMFDIPQPDSSATSTGPTVPVVDVDDTPEELENFLRMIYPFGFPAMPTLDAISNALVILDKVSGARWIIATPQVATCISRIPQRRPNPSVFPCVWLGVQGGGGSSCSLHQLP